MKLILVAGARPNFVKVAPLMKELQGRDGMAVQLVHTGQHYDVRMSRCFFGDLGIPRPDVDLEVGSGSHAFQTAEVMRRFEPVLAAERPDAVVVVGDVNSTLACALTAVKLQIPVAHVEAGLRSFDRSMPEEINRIVTDSISSWLFVSERSGIANLLREGVKEERVHFVGNVMIDTLLQHRRASERSDILRRLEVEGRPYAVLTLHRPASVDDASTLEALLGCVGRLAETIPVIFPIHPRTAAILGAAGTDLRRSISPGIRLIDPLGYLDFLKLLAETRVVLTDSGGVQEETTVLGVPCLTLRANTERPATLTEGTNRLVGLDPNRITSAVFDVLQQDRREGRRPEMWDGQASRRIADVLQTAGRSV